MHSTVSGIRLSDAPLPLDLARARAISRYAPLTYTPTPSPDERHLFHIDYMSLKQCVHSHFCADVRPSIYIRNQIEIGTIRAFSTPSILLIPSL